MFRISLSLLQNICTMMNSNAYSYNPYTVNDWMKVIRTPTPYRVGNSNARLHLKPRTVAYCVLFIIAIIILVCYFIPNSERTKLNIPCDPDWRAKFSHLVNTKYPLTDPLVFPEGLQYKIAIVTDLDTDSKSKHKSNTWISYLTYGNLSISDDHKKVSVKFDNEPITLTSSMSQGGRGMELSELVTFNGKLYTVDDRTGFVYEIWNNQVIPWVVLTDGNGREVKGNDHRIESIIHVYSFYPNKCTLHICISKFCILF